MIWILRGLRMGDEFLRGDKAVQDWCHIFAFCFALACVDALVGLGFGRHLGVSAVCFVVASLFYLTGVKWPQIKHRLRRKTKASAPAEKEVAPTLPSLMDTSFPQLNKLWGKPILHFEDGSSLEVKSALYFDLFTSGAKFLGFYVPSTPRVMEVCAVLAAHATELGDALAKGGLSITCKAPGENPQTVSDLTYSGKVYLHHDDVLTHGQMAEVEEMFKAHKLSVVLRGPDYLTSAWLDLETQGKLNMKLEPSESQKFDAVVRKVLSVSYDELKRRERKYKQKRARKKRAKTLPASRDLGA